MSFQKSRQVASWWLGDGDGIGPRRTAIDWTPHARNRCLQWLKHRRAARPLETLHRSFPACPLPTLSTTCRLPVLSTRQARASIHAAASSSAASASICWAPHRSTRVSSSWHTTPPSPAASVAITPSVCRAKSAVEGSGIKRSSRLPFFVVAYSWPALGRWGWKRQTQRLPPFQTFIRNFGYGSNPPVNKYPFEH